MPGSEGCGGMGSGHCARALGFSLEVVITAVSPTALRLFVERRLAMPDILFRRLCPLNVSSFTCPEGFELSVST